MKFLDEVMSATKVAQEEMVKVGAEIFGVPRGAIEGTETYEKLGRAHELAEELRELLIELEWED